MKIWNLVLWGLFYLGLPAVMQAQLIFTTNNGAITITGFTGTTAVVTIPSETNGYPVTSIGYDAFNCQPLTSITLPDSVTNIGACAFSGCIALTNVTFGNHLAAIGTWAFGLSGLGMVILPASVVSVGENAFGCCRNLTNITVDPLNPVYSSQAGVLFNQDQTVLVEFPGGVTAAYLVPSGVTRISDGAFEACLLTNVFLPAGVRSIGNNAFSQCASLAEIFLSAGLTNIGDSAFSECVNLVVVTLPASVASIGSCAFQSCHALTGVYFQGEPPIADSTLFFDDFGLTVYYVPGVAGWGSTFAGCRTAPSYGPLPYQFASTHGAITILRYTGCDGSLNIPNMINGLPVTSIGDSAFYGCASFTNVTIPGGVTNIGTNAFACCYNLTAMTMPDSVTTLGNNAFEDCINLASSTLSTNLTAISEGTFADCFRLTSLVLPDGITNIGGSAFYYCQQMTNLTLGPKVTSIGTNAFAYCSGLTAMTFPDSVTTLGNSAFFDCINLAHVTLGTNLAAIGDETFAYCGLTNLVIPQSVTNIGDDAFFCCRNLAAILIPGQVSQLGQEVFFNCSCLTNIAVDPLNPAYSSLAGVLFNKDQTTLIQYPGGLAGRYSISSTVALVQAGAFFDCSGLTNISVDSLNPAYASLGGVLFNKDQSLLIQFPGGLGGNYSMPDRVTSIGECAFYDCALNHLTLGAGVMNLGDYAFYGCTNLADLLIPKGVTNIGYLALNSCNSLTNIAVDPLNPAYSSLAGVLFNKDQTTLIQFPGGLGGTYSIPNSVRNVADFAFYDLPDLACLIIPDSTVSFGQEAFALCFGLTQIYIKGNAPNDDASEFVGDIHATFYYQPGTTGWDSYGFFYQAQWFLPYPVILSTPTPGGQSNQFGFTISWATNAPVVVEACTNLANPVWLPVQTNTLTSGSAYFNDPQWTNSPGRFYRLRSP